MEALISAATIDGMSCDMKEGIGMATSNVLLKTCLSSFALALAVSCNVLHAEDVPLEDIQTVVNRGSEFEKNRSWRDAIRHYKKSLKKWPQNDHLVRGLRRSQFQFAVTRRYGDSTFVQSLKPMDKNAALSLYDDILANVQGYYVDPINTTSLVAHGTESLWLALGNQKFLDENLFGADPKRVEEVRRKLFENYWNKPVNFRMGARDLIQDVCKMCQEEVGLDSGPVVMEYVFGATNCLDDYSNVLTPGKRQDLYGNIKGEFVGIGIIMEAEIGEGMKLVQVLPESPASEAGIRGGDFIVSIDNQDCRFMTTEEAANLLSGKSGSSVQLEIVRNEKSTFQANCVRREVKVKSIPYAAIIDDERKIGYIQMTGFQRSTVEELDNALAKLNQQGMKSLIWDVRENPGGLLTASIEVLDRFIDEGIIVSTKGRVPDQNSSYTAHRPGTWDMPIVLLIDGNSASASEIVAGAIRDHKRGIIVGRKSFGKWSVQSIFDLRYGTGIRITTAKFYSPNDKTYGKIGLTPDVHVQDGPENRPIGSVDIENDPDLREALRQISTPQYTKR